MTAKIKGKKMFLKKLTLTNFKNYQSAEMQFSDYINCFVGENGAGKTNILDAVYYLSFCKSYFSSSDMQNIKHEQPFFAIHGSYRNEEGNEDKVSVVQKRGHKKSVRFNGKEYDRFADHIGKIPLVMVSPYDRDLINEGSDVRRKYIDGVISQFDKFYLTDLIEYNRALLQRNRLLKDFAEHRYFDETAISVWDEIMIERGNRLFEKRKTFLREFNPLFMHYYQLLSNGKEKVQIDYSTQLDGYAFAELLKNSREKDLALRYSTAGIHKDDLQFLMSGYPVKRYGSQGQQKSFVIAVKLAQFDFTKSKIGFKPILLFDDIFDKLDRSRVAQIIDLVGEENFGQVFITDTQEERVASLFKNNNLTHAIFRVENGTVKENGLAV